ncbi:MAG: hemolysin family protein [Shewanella sp.]|uniref:hemolysin family protein n=1 Tax=Shewanella sp. SNU WT4 TaxID=2590015 RepID=UPI00112B860A|nr:hemolysin family protein [Shewanella sp. SNU WT4]QDF65850.1 HlyC/CorC family transporter [Shewanella sp. SNU WT4]
MSLFENLLIIFLLISISSFFSMSEIALAGSRKMRLRQLFDEGDLRAGRVLQLQAQPGNFFTAVQIGLNAVAILGGIVGESAFTPYFTLMLTPLLPEPYLGQISFVLSFVMVTSLFILIADLMPKRVAMAMPEQIAMALVGAMSFCIVLLKPLVWMFNGISNTVFKLLGISMARNDAITEDDIYAVMAAGTEAGVLQKDEQQLMENVFEMQSVPVTAAMTVRESLIFFLQQDTEEDMKRKIAQDPHNKFLVCDGQLDQIKGFVDAKELLMRVINGEVIDLKKGDLLHPVLIVPDTLNLSEAMEYFKNNRADFAVVMNEYALVVGVVTTNDLQSAVMGSWNLAEGEEQIVARDLNSWLVDGLTPITDVMRSFGIEEFPQSQNYETIAGFIMYMLRKIPKRTDYVVHSGFKFEVVDIDSYRVDQLLVTRIEPEKSPAESALALANADIKA